MPIPNHCIECDKPTKQHNTLCDSCLDKFIPLLSECCNAVPLTEIVDGTGICSNCKQGVLFYEEVQEHNKPAYRF